MKVLVLPIIVSAFLAGEAAQAQDWKSAPQAPSITTFTPTGDPQTLAKARLGRHLAVEAPVYTEDRRDLPQAFKRDLERERESSPAYGVAYMPVSPNAQIYARIGKGSARDTLAGERDDGWSYGAGAQISREGRKGFRADYTRQGLPRSDVKANIVSFGFVSRF